MSGLEIDAMMADLHPSNTPSILLSPSLQSGSFSPNANSFTMDLPPQHSNAPTPPSAQRSAFAAALDAARRTASASDVLGKYDTREMSLSPPPPSTSVDNNEVLDVPTSPTDTNLEYGLTSPSIAGVREMPDLLEEREPEESFLLSGSHNIGQAVDSTPTIIVSSEEATIPSVELEHIAEEAIVETTENSLEAEPEVPEVSSHIDAVIEHEEGSVSAETQLSASSPTEKDVAVEVGVDDSESTGLSLPSEQSMASSPEIISTLANSEVLPAPSAAEPSATVQSVSLQSSSLGTPSTLPARPQSMIEINESKVLYGRRVSPTTSKGVPLFIPAIDQPPPELITPRSPEETDFGSVSFHKASHSYSHPHASYVSHGNANSPNSSKPITFSAVVHRKVTEMPASSSLPSISKNPPVTPQISRVRQTVIVEPPSSPGYGDLAALMEEAALLEQRLSEGHIPSEELSQPTVEDVFVEEERSEPVAAPPVIPPPEEKVEEKAKSKSFKNPLSRSRTKSIRREPPNLYVQTPASRSATHISKMPSISSIRGVAVPQMPVHQEATPMKELQRTKEEDDIPPTPPPKSPAPKYLSGLRRLASSSSRSSKDVSGTYPRYSISTSSELSSEDSVPIITPPDDSVNFSSGQSAGIAFPSVSPRKSGSLSRASTFAEKLWHRGRTKSTVSTISATEIASKFFFPSACRKFDLYLDFNFD